MNSNQMLVTFDEYEDKWQACLNALESDYTLSFRSACKILKCDRSWVQKYIRPHVHYIYLSTGAGRKTTSYTKLASKAINKELTESIWFNTKEYSDQEIYQQLHPTDNISAGRAPYCS